MAEETLYYLKVTNPESGTYNFLRNSCSEFATDFEEFWQKNANPEVKLTYKPHCPENFSQVVILCSERKHIISFIKFLLDKYISYVEGMESVLCKLCL